MDRRVVAAGSISLPQRENVDVADVGVSVRPGARGAGIGREMLEHLLDQVRPEGRKIVHGQVASPWNDTTPTPGERLLSSLGGRPQLHEALRLLDLDALGPGASPRPLPDGYRLEQWVDVAPQDLVAGLAHLSERMSTDSPQGDLTLEPEVWDTARYRASEVAEQARNRLRSATAVVHEASGTVAGLTDLRDNRGRQEVAYQWDTIVDRNHRGHGLGLVIKAHNLALLREAAPGVRWVNTWNALSNTHKVAVNDTGSASSPSSAGPSGSCGSERGSGGNGHHVGTDDHRAVALDDGHELGVLGLRYADVEERGRDLAGHDVELLLAHRQVGVGLVHVTPWVASRTTGLLDRPGGDEELEAGVPHAGVEGGHVRVAVGGGVVVEPVGKAVDGAGDAVGAAEALVEGGGARVGHVAPGSRGGLTRGAAPV